MTDISVLAVSHEDAVLSLEVWRRAVELDEEAQKRMTSREEARKKPNGST
jgi:hypothetical protein